MAACLAAGMGLAVGLERTMTPPSLSDSSDAGNLALGSEEFDDVRSLNVDVTASPAGGVAFPVSGRVTFASCPADGVVRCVLSSCYRPVWREFSFRKSGRF